MKPTPRIQNHRGFTIAELLIVMTIILILAGLVIGGMSFVKTKQKNHQAEIQIKLLEKAIQEYHSDNGEYPGAEDAGGTDGTGESNMLFQALYYDGFQAADGSIPIYLSELDPITDPQKWVSGTGATATITDPWGEEYRYRRGPGALNPDFDLWSSGPDLETAGDGEDPKDKDDIRNF